MFEQIRKFFARFIKTEAEKIIDKALQCTTLAELNTLQPIAILKSQKNSSRFAGKRMTVIEYLRHTTDIELIAPRILVQFLPVPLRDPREFPMYSIYISMYDNWYDTNLLVVTEKNSSYPVIIHKAEYFGILNFDF